jgi:hypothetical protein
MIESSAWVDQNGEVIESSGDPLPLYSITKAYLAAAILAMKIDLQEPISNWIDRALCPRVREAGWNAEIYSNFGEFEMSLKKYV